MDTDEHFENYRNEAIAGGIVLKWSFLAIYDPRFISVIMGWMDVRIAQTKNPERAQTQNPKRRALVRRFPRLVTSGLRGER